MYFQFFFLKMIIEEKLSMVTVATMVIANIAIDAIDAVYAIDAKDAIDAMVYSGYHYKCLKNGLDLMIGGSEANFAKK